MADRALIEKISAERAKRLQDEVAAHFPGAKVGWHIDEDGRGVVTASLDSFIISKEFVETEESISKPTRFSEYYRVMANKSRLVLIVPKRMALKVRLRMLDFNQMWLFYYIVYSYDGNGNLQLIDRSALRRMIIQASTPSCPDVA